MIRAIPGIAQTARTSDHFLADVPGMSPYSGPRMRTTLTLMAGSETTNAAPSKGAVRSAPCKSNLVTTGD